MIKKITTILSERCFRIVLSVDFSVKITVNCLFYGGLVANKSVDDFLYYYFTEAMLTKSARGLNIPIFDEKPNNYVSFRHT